MQIAMASPVCILQRQSSVTVLASSTIVPPSKGRQLAALSCPSQTLSCSPTCEIVREESPHWRHIALPMQRALCLRRCQATLVGKSLSSKAIGRRSHQPVVCETAAVEVGEGARFSEGGQQQKAEVGNRIKVKGPLIVYHVPKVPKYDIGGLEGEVKDVIFQHKGRPVSATFPYKVQFNTELEERKLKFFAHLKDDEFEVVE